MRPGYLLSLLLSIAMRGLTFGSDFQAVLEPIDLAPDELLWLSSCPTVRVATDPSWAPVEYRDTNGNMQGLSVGYLSTIASNLNIRFEFDAGKDRRSTMEALESGRYDMASAIVPTPDRRERLLFTRPFMTMRFSVFGRIESPFIEDLDDLVDSRVMVVAGSAVGDFLKRDHPRLRLLEISTIEVALNSLSHGKADYFVGDLASTGWYRQKLGVQNVKVSGETSYELPLTMGVRKDLSPLFSILDKAILNIPKDQASAIRKEWLSTPAPRDPDFGILFILAGIALALAASTLAWSLLLSARVRSRTSSLDTALQQQGVLMAELNHRVKNNLQMALSLVRLSSQSADGTERDILDGAAGRLEAITRVHETLDPQAAVQDLKVDLGDYLRRLVSEGSSLAAVAGRVSLVSELARDVRVSMKTAVNVGLVVNELLTNAGKYAFPEGRPGSVHLKLRLLPKDRAEVEVIDDGIGMVKGSSRPESLGLRLVKSIVRGFGVALECSTSPDKGTSWRFSVPLD